MQLDILARTISLIEENFEIQNNACDKFKYDLSKQN